MFDLRKLEVFCKVCELGSFSKAGEAMFLSQPTISAHIQSLERDLNVRLLDRMGKGVLPTPAGTVLLSRVKNVFAQLESAKEEISTLSSDVVGDITIGSTVIPAHHVLPALLTQFLDMHPKVTPSLSIGTTTEILHAVGEGELMAAIVGGTESANPDLHLTPLIDDDIIIVAPPGADLDMLPSPKRQETCGLPSISFEEASRMEWIFQDETSHTRKEFENALRRAGYDPKALNQRLAVDNSQSTLQYVAAGLGVSIASRTAVADMLRFKKLCGLSIRGVQAAQTFSCAINTKRTLFPAASMFLEFLHKATAHLRKAQI